MSALWSDEDSDELDRQIRHLRRQDKRERSSSQPAVISGKDRERIVRYPLRDQEAFVPRQRSRRKEGDQ